MCKKIFSVLVLMFLMGGIQPSYAGKWCCCCGSSSNNPEAEGLVNGERGRAAVRYDGGAAADGPRYERSEVKKSSASDSGGSSEGNSDGEREKRRLKKKKKRGKSSRRRDGYGAGLESGESSDEGAPAAATGGGVLAVDYTSQTIGDLTLYFPRGTRFQEYEDSETGNRILCLPNVAIAVFVPDVYASNDTDVTELLAKQATARPSSLQSLKRRVGIMCGDVQDQSLGDALHACFTHTIDDLGILPGQQIPVLLQRDDRKRASRVLIQNENSGVLVKVPDQM